MKILAIRGRNLASLAGDFELDFTAPPLAGSGLFAITGETGAGKSTILDALCLALFGRFPRIATSEQKDRFNVAHGDALLTSDPRTILRTSSHEALAQVDLEIRGERLRASWQVRRARGRLSGNLLSAERTLESLDEDRVIASGKTRVEEEIADKLGLTYDQFSRIVLLAQNNFDAFLRANDTERAALLEKITGTALYSKLSIRTHEAARNAQSELMDARRSTGDVQVLPDGEREALSKSLAAAVTERDEVQKEAETMRAALAWYKQHDHLVERAQAAQQLSQEAEEALGNRTGEQSELAGWRQAKNLLGVIERADEKTAESAKTRAELNALETRLKQQGEQVPRLEANARSLRERHGEARTRLAQAAPQLEQALALETRFEELKNRHEEAETLRKQALAARDELARMHKTRLKEHKALAGQIARLQSSLEDRSALNALQGRKPEIERQFEQLAGYHKDLADAKARVDQTLSRKETLQSQRLTDEEAQQKHQSHRQKVELSLTQKAQALAHAAPDKLRLEHDRHRSLQAEIAALKMLLRQQVEQSNHILEAEQQEKEAEASQSEALSALARLDRRLGDLNARLSEAADLVARSQDILAPETLVLRAGLRADSPCPVCGSLEHPGHDDEAATRLLAQMRDRKDELRTEISALNEQRHASQLEGADARARRDQARGQIKMATARMKALVRERDKQLAIIARSDFDHAPLSTLAGPSLAGEPAAQLQALTLFEQSISGSIERLNHALAELQKLEAAHQELRDQLIRIDQKERLENERSSALKTRCDEAQKEVEQAKSHACAIETKWQMSLDQLLPQLAGFDLSRRDLLRDISGSNRRIFLELARYERDQADLLQKTENEGEINRALALLGERLERQDADLERATKESSRFEEACQQLAKERLALFDGRSAREVRLEMEQQASTAASALAAAAAKKLELQTSRIETEKQIAKTSKTFQACRKQLDAAIERQNTSLQKAGLELSACRALLALDEAWMIQRETELQELGEAAQSARTQLQDRRRHLDEHNETPPHQPIEDLQDKLRDLEASLAMINQDLGKNSSRLELDDEARKQRSTLDKKVRRLEQRQQVWAAVNEAIGSHDGSRFQRFAQGITLDHLIALANEQLRNINPRYLIQRIHGEGGGLGLQVEDRDMGGEIRAVRSLSGGERFLVSLALALALSRLDGRHSFIDMLMIDEGFGALDARSLDMAVEALESLQSQGRKVGVISHIEALTERIAVQVVVEKQGEGRSLVRVREQRI